MEQIEKVIDAFWDYIKGKPYLDFALTKKGKYLYLLDGMEDEIIDSGEWLCNRLLYDIEVDFEIELAMKGKEMNSEQRLIMYRIMKQYIDKLPEYKYLLDRYEV